MKHLSSTGLGANPSSVMDQVNDAHEPVIVGQPVFLRV
jgi:hypothetical protein